VKTSISPGADPEDDLGVPEFVEPQNATVGSDKATKNAMGFRRTTGQNR